MYALNRRRTYCRSPKWKTDGNEYWGAHQDHFTNFFEGMRTGEAVPEDAVFGYRAAAPALLCNDSFFEEKMLRWDPVNMQVVE